MIIYDSRNLTATGRECAANLVSSVGERFLGGVQSGAVLVLFFESPVLGVFHHVYLVQDGDLLDVTRTIMESAQGETIQ